MTLNQFGDNNALMRRVRQHAQMTTLFGPQGRSEAPSWPSPPLFHPQASSPPPHARQRTHNSFSYSEEHTGTASVQSQPPGEPSAPPPAAETKPSTWERLKGAVQRQIRRTDAGEGGERLSGQTHQPPIAPSSGEGQAGGGWQQGVRPAAGRGEAPTAAPSPASGAVGEGGRPAVAAPLLGGAVSEGAHQVQRQATVEAGGGVPQHGGTLGDVPIPQVAASSPASRPVVAAPVTSMPLGGPAPTSGVADGLLVSAGDAAPPSVQRAALSTDPGSPSALAAPQGAGGERAEPAVSAAAERTEAPSQPVATEEEEKRNWGRLQRIFNAHQRKETAAIDAAASAVQRPPLEEAWPVQRADGGESPRGGEAADEMVRRALSGVRAGQRSDSSIELVMPSRPRPAPRATEARRPVKGQPAEEPRLVPTEIGALPSDLWTLLDEAPPGSEQEKVARVAQPAEEEGVASGRVLGESGRVTDADGAQAPPVKKTEKGEGEINHTLQRTTASEETAADETKRGDAPLAPHPAPPAREGGEGDQIDEVATSSPKGEAPDTAVRKEAASPPSMPDTVLRQVAKAPARPVEQVGVEEAPFTEVDPLLSEGERGSGLTAGELREVEGSPARPPEGTRNIEAQPSGTDALLRKVDVPPARPNERTEKSESTPSGANAVPPTAEASLTRPAVQVGKDESPYFGADALLRKVEVPLAGLNEGTEKSESTPPGADTVLRAAEAPPTRPAAQALREVAQPSDTIAVLPEVAAPSAWPAATAGQIPASPVEEKAVPRPAAELRTLEPPRPGEEGVMRAVDRSPARPDPQQKTNDLPLSEVDGVLREVEGFPARPAAGAGQIEAAPIEEKGVQRSVEAGRSGPLMAVQRPSAELETAAGAAPEAAPEMDVAALADAVYGEVKRRMGMEWERGRGRL